MYLCNIIYTDNEEEPKFGVPTCMVCGKICNIVEFINEPIEMWCWCSDCQIDTFHEPLNSGNEYNK